MRGAAPAGAGPAATNGGSESGADREGDSRRRSRSLLAAFFIGAGVNHFLIPRAYRSIMPAALQEEAELLVAVSGAAEIAGGLGVLVPRTRRSSGVALIVLLAAVFPANIHMAMERERFARVPRWALYGRLGLQPLMMIWAWKATRR